MQDLLRQMMAGEGRQNRAREAKPAGPYRKANSDYNFQTNPNAEDQNNMMQQIMKAKKSQFTKGTNSMETKQQQIKNRILKMRNKNAEAKDDRIRETKDQKYKKDLLEARKRDLIVQASSKIQQTSQDIYQNLIPNALYHTHTASDSRVYGGRFTSKGNLYYCSSQSQILVYDTSDPYNWKQRSAVDAHQIRWTVTDMDVDKDENFLIYSSISPLVHLVDIATLSNKHERLNFTSDDNGYGGWALMSIKFSGDGREILGGTKSGHILIYDLQQNRVTTAVGEAHDDEINSVCWANRDSSNLLFTGSDDCFVKVWDRRNLANSRRPAGVFIGHQEGVTNVTSKGDGLHLASNGKDQLLKVWDIRKMSDFNTFDRHLQPLRRAYGFDYRGDRYPNAGKQTKHPQDSSLFTFMGHGVLSTLIRCQFSPIETTGQRYVYTGSSDGRIHIYDLLTGGTAMKLPEQGRTSGEDAQGYYYGGNRKFGAPARDVSWHPHYPILASTSFDQSVKIWTLQNLRTNLSVKENEPEEVATEEENMYDEEEVEEEAEEEDSNNLFSVGSGGGSSVSIQQLMQYLMRRQGQSGGVEMASRGGDEGAEDDDDDEDEDIDTNGDMNDDEEQLVGYKILDQEDEPISNQESSSAQPGYVTSSQNETSQNETSQNETLNELIEEDANDSDFQSAEENAIYSPTLIDQMNKDKEEEQIPTLIEKEKKEEEKD